MNISEFEDKWVSKLEDGILKSFPDDFILDEKCITLELPGKHLLKGSELFGQYELIDTDGNALMSTDNLDKIKYILHANRNLPLKIKVVEDANLLTAMLKKYNNHLDEILRMIAQDFKSEFPTSDKVVSVSNKIFQRLNLHRY